MSLYSMSGPGSLLTWTSRALDTPARRLGTRARRRSAEPPDSWGGWRRDRRVGPQKTILIAPFLLPFYAERHFLGEDRHAPQDC